MLARKLSFLADNIRLRARDGHPYSPDELEQVAAVIRALLPMVEQMESRPVPPALRVIQGGAAQ